MALSRAKKTKGKSRGKSNSKTRKRSFRPGRWLMRMGLRAAVCAAFVLAVAVLAFKFVNPPTTHTMWSEGRRLGEVKQVWVNVDDIAPVMLRSAVAAEDANFCKHWGFDMSAIRAAVASGARRGGSTISQQVAKNVYLWQQRSYIRKALEALITPAIEAGWSKRRIMEIYLNVAEFDTGVFGVGAASRHYFGVSADKLSARQAALLAAVLPSPKRYSASKPSSSISRRANRIMDGAATIKADGRSACFE